MRTHGTRTVGLVMAVLVLGLGGAARADGCSGNVTGIDSCVRSHPGYTSSEPKPTASWSGNFTGFIEAQVIGNFGATSTLQCVVVAGIGSCSRPRWDFMQAGEAWTLRCMVTGNGGWGCDHSGGL